MRVQVRRLFSVVIALSALSVGGCGGGGGGKAQQTPPQQPPPPPPPTIRTMLPIGATAGTTAFTLTVYGSDFVSGSTVQWNGNARPTTYVSASQLTAQIGAGDIAIAGTEPVTVANGSSSGGTSSAVNFKINAPVSCPNGSSNGLSVCISNQGGTPRLIINGVPTPPLVFFGNLEEPQSQWPLVTPEVKSAAANGIHLYKVATDIPWTGTDYSWVDPLVAFYVTADPNAMVIVEFSGTVADELGTFVVPPGNDYLYADGTTSPMSKASDFYFSAYQTAVVNAVNHFESGPYAGHIIAYWICADATGEWFDPNYRTKGPDYSTVNVAAFQQWLTNKYGTDAALAAAWGQAGLTLATAAVPVAPAGRFPMAGVTAGQQINAFYTPVSQQNWVDYSNYVSDLNTSRILQIAQAAKQATQGHKLVGLYYGYMFDLAGSFSGHQNIFPILASSDVDILAAPVSYINPTDRLSGGAGGAMSPIDSIALHGKLWFNEDDLWTWLAAASGVPANPVITNPPTQGFTDTNGILQRNLASILMHRAGTWWLDLNANGAFNDPNLWLIMSQYGLPLYNDVYSNPTQFTADVEVLVDETSVFYQQNDWDFLYQPRAELRNTIVKTGATAGFYYLADFISGLSPPAKAYFFANDGFLTDSQVTAIRARLSKEGATAIWQHAPGFLGGSQTGAAGTSVLTGMTLSEADGPDYTIGAGLLAGMQFGFGTQNTLVPRLSVNDATPTGLGTWATGGGVSAATLATGGFTSVFLGDFALGNPDVLRKLLTAAGAHIWLSTDDVFLCDGRHLVIHAASTGTKTVTLPASLVDASTGLSTITASMQLGDTQFFILR
jgi:hypothetical protein